MKRAFTLIEILAVVVIITVASGFGIIIAHSRMSSIALSDSCYSILSAGRHAHSLAVMGKGNCNLCIDQGDGSYWIETGEEVECDEFLFASEAMANETLTENVYARRNYVNQKVHIVRVKSAAIQLINDGVIRLPFNSDGTAASGLITLGAGNSSKSILIWANTSRVELVRGDVELLPQAVQDINKIPKTADSVFVSQ